MVLACLAVGAAIGAVNGLLVTRLRLPALISRLATATIMVEVDESQAVELPLQPGEMSLHHVRLIHGSEPNPSGKRRIGFAIRYLPTYVRQAVGGRDSAMLVRGVDTYGHFDPEQRPEFDMAPGAQAHHAEVMARTNRVLMRDTPLVVP